MEKGTDKRPLLATSSKIGRKRKSIDERVSNKRAYEQRRAQSRVCIGSSIDRWRKLQSDLGLKTDAETAEFLLNR